MLITITNEQKVKVTAAPTTAAGNPAEVQDLTFTVTDGDATVELIEGEPNSAYLVSGEANVNSVIEVSADADLGEGVQTIADRIDLAVVAAGASALGFTVGEPELK